jgi:hypothetical protein
MPCHSQKVGPKFLRFPVAMPRGVSRGRATLVVTCDIGADEGRKMRVGLSEHQLGLAPARPGHVMELFTLAIPRTSRSSSLPLEAFFAAVKGRRVDLEDMGGLVDRPGVCEHFSNVLVLDFLEACSAA